MHGLEGGESRMKISDQNVYSAAVHWLQASSATGMEHPRNSAHGLVLVALHVEICPSTSQAHSRTDTAWIHHLSVCHTIDLHHDQLPDLVRAAGFFQFGK